MKKYFLRFGAFLIDTVIVLIATVLVCLIPFINPNLKEMGDKQDALNHEIELARNLKEKTENYIKDNKINKFEYKEILDDFPTYYDLFKDVVIDEELTDDFKNNIQTKIEEKYIITANDYSYGISKLSLNETIVNIVICMLYFGVLPFIMNGQTLAKKILRLKVVDNKDEKRKIPLWKYLVRAFLICEIVFTIANLIMINVMTKDIFINATYWLNKARYIYEIIFLICLVLREDQRSIHDLLLNTTVIRIDKEGNKIDNPTYISSDIKQEEVKEEKESFSKKTTVKKRQRNKEEVKAEKVND